MGFLARNKSIPGGGPSLTTITPTTADSSLRITPDRDVFIVSIAANATVTYIYSTNNEILPGRRVTLIGSGSFAVTLTNNTATTTNGQMDLAGSDRTLVADSVVSLVQITSGAWRIDGLNL